ncbi:hypothetical protein ScPMuIL_005290 [Solemya velum]
MAMTFMRRFLGRPSGYATDIMKPENFAGYFAKMLNDCKDAKMAYENCHQAIHSADTNLEQIESCLDSMAGDIDSYDSMVDSVGNKLTSIRSKIADKETNIDALRLDIESYQTRIKTWRTAGLDPFTCKDLFDGHDDLAIGAARKLREDRLSLEHTLLSLRKDRILCEETSDEIRQELENVKILREELGLNHTQEIVDLRQRTKVAFEARRLTLPGYTGHDLSQFFKSKDELENLRSGVNEMRQRTQCMAAFMRDQEQQMDFIRERNDQILAKIIHTQKQISLETQSRLVRENINLDDKIVPNAWQALSVPMLGGMRKFIEDALHQNNMNYIEPSKEPNDLQDFQPTMSQDLVDLDELVIKWADSFPLDKNQRKEAEKTTPTDINWDHLRVNHGPTEYFDQIQATKPKTHVLLTAHFTNETDQLQVYTLRTERRTNSVCSLNIEKGYTYGASVDIKLTPPNPIIEANAGFHGELSMTKGTEQTFEEELVWSVDNQISVPSLSATKAELVIKEDSYTSNFKTETRFKGLIHVTLYNKKDRTPITTLTVTAEEALGKDKRFRTDKNGVYLISQGSCKCRFGVEQNVRLSQSKIKLEDKEDD